SRPSTISMVGHDSLAFQYSGDVDFFKFTAPGNGHSAPNTMAIRWSQQDSGGHFLPGTPLRGGDNSPLLAALTVSDGAGHILRPFSPDPLSSTDADPANVAVVRLQPGTTYYVKAAYAYTGLTPPIFPQLYTLSFTPYTDDFPSDWQNASASARLVTLGEDP